MAKLECWKCGDDLGWLMFPLGRLEACKACGADLHVCRLCEFYDTTFANSCREPIADKVNDKERANFCGYLKPVPGAHRPVGTAAAQSHNKLAALFGDTAVDSATDTEEAARRQLDELFGKNDAGD